MKMLIFKKMTRNPRIITRNKIVISYELQVNYAGLAQW